MYTRAHRVAIECFRLLIRARGYTDLDELGFIMILRIIICDECELKGDCDEVISNFIGNVRLIYSLN